MPTGLKKLRCGDKITKLLAQSAQETKKTSGVGSLSKTLVVDGTGFEPVTSAV
jgi:hypothetical protein